MEFGATSHTCVANGSVVAVETASRQVGSHRQGESVDAITGHLLKDIWPTRPPTRLADTFTMDWEEEAV